MTKVLNKNEDKRVVDIEDAEELLVLLEGIHPSKAHEVIVSVLTIKQIRMFKGNDELQKRFQDLKQKAKQSYTHDNSYARMKDVDAVGTRIYTILLRMIRTMAEDQILMQEAMNEMRAKMDLPLIEFDNNRENNGAEVAEEHAK